jgi:hypothetical protein
MVDLQTSDAGLAGLPARPNLQFVRADYEDAARAGRASTSPSAAMRFPAQRALFARKKDHGRAEAALLVVASLVQS